MRSFFGIDTVSQVLESPIEIHPSRSPFINERLAVLVEAETVEQLWGSIKGLKVGNSTFKVVYVKSGRLSKEEKLSLQQRRLIEKQTGLLLDGTVDLVAPECLFGIMKLDRKWVFGELLTSKAVWFQHQSKPHQYSTALSTRVARAVVNIAVPNPVGVKVIDPCCGIGTVLIEALSMGIDIVGSDINFQVLPGTRENIQYFGYRTEITLADIRNVKGHFDVAIIDMPYNLCSVLSIEEKIKMLLSARDFASKVVVVTIEPLDEILEHVGFRIIDRCVAKKSSFTREIIVCM